MYLEIEHSLAFGYDAYVRESFLELRMQPKTDAHQTLQSFVLAVGPPTRLFRYRDWLDNAVHHFTVASFHDRIAVQSRSLVHTHPAGPAPGDVGDPMPLAEVPWEVLDFRALGGPVAESAALGAFADIIPIPPG